VWERIANLAITRFDISIVIEEPNQNWHHLCKVDIRRLVGVKKKTVQSGLRGNRLNRLDGSSQITSKLRAKKPAPRDTTLLGDLVHTIFPVVEHSLPAWSEPAWPLRKYPLTQEYATGRQSPWILPRF